MSVRLAAAAVALLAVSGCATQPKARTGPTRERIFSTTVVLHGKPLELHVAAPPTREPAPVLVLYASGDGGWFGAAVDMFRQIADAGYVTVGFSSRALLRLERPQGALANPAQLADEYDQIVAQARAVLGLREDTGAVLTGWSRGAAFSVLAATEPVVRHEIVGVLAIGLANGEDLAVNDADDETDPGPAAAEPPRFDTYAQIARLGSLPCAVIQSTHDNYFPASGARRLMGPDTTLRRLYVVDAKNHRFSGGKPAFHAALVDAIGWIVAHPAPLTP